MEAEKGTSTANIAFHSQPVSPSDSQTTISNPLISPQELSQELSQRLGTIKSVHFINESTSTTNLQTKEPIKRLRPELSTLLTCLIKQTRSLVKSSHHIELLQTAIINRDPPRGLRPKVNPRIPDSKRIDFIIEWEEVTNTAALNYTKLLLKQWEFTRKTSIENTENLESRIKALNANEEEWIYIKETLTKIEQQTKEDLEKKTVRRTPSRQTQIQPQQQQEEEPQIPYPGTSGIQQNNSPRQFYHAQLPQRNREDFRGNNRQ